MYKIGLCIYLYNIVFLKMIVVVVFLVSLSATSIASYSREEVRKYYPFFGTDYILFPDENNEPIFGYLNMENNSKLFGFSEYDLDKDVKFDYYSRESPEGTPITTLSDLSKYVNISKPTKFVTHGWMSGGKKNSCVLIKNGFLHRYDANVFIMDWSEISGNILYPIPMMATPEVGEHYGKYLNYLIEEVGVDPQDIHLVGHSLGAHVSGFAGREVKKGKLGRITGLDPALPGFDLGLIPSGTLNKDDADFVDIIHTCAGYLGFKLPLGHADFYPNGGGPPQPGCGILEFIEVCSHGRSWKIYASTLMSDTHQMATKCSTFDDIEKKKNCDGDQVPIGDPTPPDTLGIFYSTLLDSNLIYSDED